MEEAVLSGLFSQLTSDKIGFAMLATLAGLFVHFGKKVLRDGYEWASYWKTQGVSSLMSIVGSMGSSYALFETGETQMLAFFFIGYAADSLLNKADKVSA